MPATLGRMGWVGILLLLVVWPLWSASVGDHRIPRGVLPFSMALASVGIGFLALLLLLLGVTPAQRRRRIALPALASAMGAGIGWLILELLFFAFGSRHPLDNPWYIGTRESLVADERLPFARRPHLLWEGSSRGDLAMRTGDQDPYARTVRFQTDHQGFRNDSDLDRADLVFIGDSYTEAGNLPTEETFPSIVGRALKRSFRNLGRAGYSTPSESIVLETYALPSEPSYVIWQIAESNDLRGALRYRQWIEAGRPDSTYRKSKTLLQRWQARSPTFRLFLRLRGPEPWAEEGYYEDQNGSLHRIRFRWKAPDSGQRPEGHPGWPALEAALREGARLTRRHDIDLTFLIVPTKIRVLGPYARNEKGEPLLDPADDLHSGETLAARVFSLASELGVRAIDTTDGLKASASRGELPYLPLDTHLSTRGHEVVAQLIVEALEAAMDEGPVETSSSWTPPSSRPKEVSGGG